MVKEIEVVTVPGEHALSELTEALSEAEATGFHPILVGDVHDYDRILERLESGDSPESILRESNHFEPGTYFAAGDQSTGGIKGESDGSGYQGIVTHLDRASGIPKPAILIRNFKAPAAWHAFAHLAWGGWKSCPSPKVHCAVHRHWADCYGAKVVSITSSEVQCIVSTPPVDQQSALELARYQIAYCGNIAQSAGDLAAKLMHAKFWYFCWD